MKFKGFHIVAPGLVKVITFGFARAISLWPFVFYKYKPRPLNPLRDHETVHIYQQSESLVVGVILFLILSLTLGTWIPTLLVLPLFYYNFINWLILVFIVGWSNAYYYICFEKEAEYYEVIDISNRKPFGWIKFIR